MCLWDCFVFPLVSFRLRWLCCNAARTAPIAHGPFHVSQKAGKEEGEGGEVAQKGEGHKLKRGEDMVK